MGQLAAASAPAFISELAKLDVLYEFVPSRRPIIHEQLRQLGGDLEIKAASENAGSVGASLRAVDAEVRHLESDMRQRHLEKVPRLLGMPLVSTYISKIRLPWQSKNEPTDSP